MRGCYTLALPYYLFVTRSHTRFVKEFRRKNLLAFALHPRVCRNRMSTPKRPATQHIFNTGTPARYAHSFKTTWRNNSSFPAQITADDLSIRDIATDPKKKCECRAIQMRFTPPRFNARHCGLCAMQAPLQTISYLSLNFSVASKAILAKASSKGKSTSCTPVSARKAKTRSKRAQSASSPSPTPSPKIQTEILNTSTLRG